MTVTATRIHNDVSPHPHLGQQGGGGGAHHRASGSFDAQSLLAARTRDFDAMRREFQYHLNLAQEAITLADRECHEDHHGYHSQPRPTTLHQAQALDNFMQAQVLNARHKLQHANEVLHAANLHIAQLSAEAIGIDTSQKTHPGPDIHEHYQRKVFQLNLEKERLSRIAHAALAREGQLSHALLRKNEAGHILADLHHKMAEHNAAEAHRLAHVITACHITTAASIQAEQAAGCNHTPSPAACAVSPPTAPTPSHPVQRDTVLSAMGSAMRPLAVVAPLAAGAQGALLSTAASAQTSVLSEVGLLALSMARMPLGVGLLAFSSKAGEGSDKVPGRENGVPAALLAQPGNDANAINYSGLGREASITREANRDVGRYSSRDDVAHHAAGPQPDSDNVALGAQAGTAAEMSRHDRQPQALSSAQANALAKSASAQADDSPPAQLAKSAVKAKTRIDAKTPAENNALAITPAAGTLTGDAVTDASQTLASSLDGKLNKPREVIEKATECAFGLICSSDDSSQSNGPNVGQDLTDAQKAELGGSGSGTPGGWEPQDEENARAKQSAEIARQDVEKLGYDTNKVSHIFADKHEVSSLIKEFGSSEAALKEMHNAVQHLANNPGTYQTGSWVTVRLGKNYVSVKGIVINGEFKISTATMRSF